MIAWKSRANKSSTEWWVGHLQFRRLVPFAFSYSKEILVTKLETCQTNPGGPMALPRGGYVVRETTSSTDVNIAEYLVYN